MPAIGPGGPPATGVVVRPRSPTDLPALVTLLAAQQPRSHYPFRWPLPFPPEQFIVRDTESHAWVAELDAGAAGPTVVGHIAVTAVADDDFTRAWTAGTGRPPSELGCISAFFVDESRRGLGIGGGLLDHAVALLRSQRRIPVLDVVQRHGTALAVYRHRGWRVVGEARPPWLPDEEPPVLAMVLDEKSSRPGPSVPPAEPSVDRSGGN